MSVPGPGLLGPVVMKMKGSVRSPQLSSQLAGPGAGRGSELRRGLIGWRRCHYHGAWPGPGRANNGRGERVAVIGARSWSVRGTSVSRSSAGYLDAMASCDT